jgi:tryptophanase
MGDELDAAGVPFVKPPGGHAVYLDAGSFAAHIPAEQFPGQSLACALYLEVGIRSCEIGGVMFGKEAPPPMEPVRLAFPRRVYTQSHFDYVIEVIPEVFENRERLLGMQLEYEAPALRHFTARFRYL